MNEQIYTYSHSLIYVFTVPYIRIHIAVYTYSHCIIYVIKLLTHGAMFIHHPGHPGTITKQHARINT